MVADNSPPPATAEPSPKVESETNETTTPRVQMRAKSNGAAAKPPVNTTTNGQQANEKTVNDVALNALERAMGTLHETSPETEDNNEEIRRLDNQLDHLNEYINKVEERLNAHNAKLRETLKQQREDREKRRQSFHERLETNRQEDDEFQKQLNALLNQITLSRTSEKQSAE
ncbi:hypothetical protein M3Y94_00883200 [Aphelenchoides besseyi]|nr:hypothetical protein M3Y94_00883200 [Aphelenchoides besseyi]KAI6223523.1 hypothetical protein M3Y95_00899000 [Aphelenchoides besseyi]